MHPFARKGGHAARRAKARKLAAGGCAGSDKMPFSSAGVESRRNRKSPDESDMMAAGHKSAKRYARGGKTKSAKHVTNIAIHLPPHHLGMAGAPEPAMAGPAPMAGPPGMPPPGPPPGVGMAPGVAPGLPPGRARGGRTGLPDAGSASGLGREQQADWVRRRGG